MLRVTVRFPLGVYHAQSTTDFATAEWPPHPARLVAALIAAAYGRPAGDRAAALDAVEVIAAAGAPLIVAPRIGNPEEADGRTRVARLRGASRWAPRNHELAELRGGKGISPRDPGRGRAEVQKVGVAIGETPMTFEWPELTVDDATLVALCELAQDVTVLGTARSPVLVSVNTDGPPADAETVWARTDAVGEAVAQVRVPTPRTPAELDAWHARRAAPLRRDGTVARASYVPPASLGEKVAYIHGIDAVAVPSEPTDAEWWGDMLIVAVDRDRSQDLPKAPATFALARAMRKALLDTYGPEGTPEEAPTILRGRESQPHAAFVPLSFVAERQPHIPHEPISSGGAAFADGRTLGVAVILPHPRRVPDVARRRLEVEAGLSRLLGLTSHEPVPVRVPGVGPVWLALPDGRRVADTLREARYRRSSSRWSTVTPIVHSRHRAAQERGGIVRAGRPGMLGCRASRARQNRRPPRLALSRRAGADRRQSAARLVDRAATGSAGASGPLVRSARPWPDSARPRSPLRSRSLPAVQRRHRQRRPMISFRDFVAATGVSGARTPYPWQEALALRLAAGQTPRAIVVPTGGGKTMTVDALLWALAAQADRAPRDRTVGVRTVWAIDRRILVDEVHARAAHLAHRLGAAAEDPADDLHDMALRLQSLAGGTGEPLRVTRWRGGLPAESRAHHPFQPEIITSTVAQIGSRLLFRGYGIGERSLALEAALAAVDTTICLDEAHLAEPFRQTIDAIRAIRARETISLPGLRAITLTATPVAGIADADVHRIGDADRAVLAARLTGEKLARLVEPASDRDVDQLSCLVKAVDEHLEGGAMTIACVVNSVRTAIDVHASLSRHRPDIVCTLLIGPQRPADREQLLARYRRQLFDRAPADKPLVCVATQTFEVGLDADVEALVTQSAAGSALVQRLGRLNRAGASRGRATIVRDTQSRLYADDEPQTWQWLRSLERPDGTIDVSVDALMNDQTPPTPSRVPGAPALTDEVVELLVQTAPRPARMADPDVEVFLRGAEAQTSTDVGLCWRCDLRLTDRSASGRSYRQALLRLVPPEPEEIVTLSFARAQALLQGIRAPRAQRAAVAKTGLDTPDVEGGDIEAATVNLAAVSASPGEPAHVVAIRGREQFEVALDRRGDPGRDLRPGDVRPGDVLVLPTSAGGYENGAIAPASRSSVEDIAADVRATTNRTVSPAALRVSDEVLALTGSDPRPILHRAERCDIAPGRAGLDELCRLLGPTGERIRAIGELELRRVTPDADRYLGDLSDDDLTPNLEETEQQNPADDQRLAVSGIGRPAFVLLARPAATPEELRPFRQPPPTLEEHATAVAKRASSFIAGASLPEPVAAAVVLAARAHDHGKGDPRFQAFFRGGVPAFLDAPLAKSFFGTADIQSTRAARTAAGLPRGLRHELASVAALADAVTNTTVADMPEEVDIELALHLVGTHHGLGRPIPRVPSTSPAGAREFVVSAAGIAGRARGDAAEGWEAGAWLRRFLAIVDRYGPWGSAYLETLLMLADRTVSREGN